MYGIMIYDATMVPSTNMMEQIDQCAATGGDGRGTFLHGFSLIIMLSATHSTGCLSSAGRGKGQIIQIDLKTFLL